ncbi:type II toxin-antitoxin system RelE/ParE family toxin [Cellvibrio sp. NN19]|uniref:type II toxin-antitoxin system RelE/ParE family toxin n=1 Tax=Cellvibrio chitinivorans TaxID=3102792 RepID=UPI002B400FE1|nr:type II toxin-antitoxin system RelE/ParE family toxin [Cellvibrio sp. NN19]
MGKFLLTDESVEHLKAIANYSRKTWGIQQQKQYLSGLRSVLSQLSETPLMGTLRFTAEHIYSFPYVSHMIYYRIQQDQIIILAVLHQSMTPEVHLKKE